MRDVAGARRRRNDLRRARRAEPPRTQAAEPDHPIVDAVPFDQIQDGQAIGAIGDQALRAIYDATVRFRREIHLVAPRDLTACAKNLALVRAELLGDQSAKHAWTAIEVVIRGPDGTLAQLPPNEVAKDKLGNA